jgi:choline-glycine betaine transporter
MRNTEKNEELNYLMQIFMILVLFEVSVYISRNYEIKEASIVVLFPLTVMFFTFLFGFFRSLKETEETQEEKDKASKLVDIFWGQGFPTRRWEDPATVIKIQERRMRQTL